MSAQGFNDRGSGWMALGFLHLQEADYDRQIGLVYGRKPWAWSALPGLGTFDGEMYCWAWPGWTGRERDGWLSSRRLPSGGGR